MQLFPNSISAIPREPPVCRIHFTGYVTSCGEHSYTTPHGRSRRVRRIYINWLLARGPIFAPVPPSPPRAGPGPAIFADRPGGQIGLTLTTPSPIHLPCQLAHFLCKLRWELFLVTTLPASHLSPPSLGLVRPKARPLTHPQTVDWASTRPRSLIQFVQCRTMTCNTKAPCKPSELLNACDFLHVSACQKSM